MASQSIDDPAMDDHVDHAIDHEQIVVASDDAIMTQTRLIH